MMRREALQERKEALAADLRSMAIASIPDPVERVNVLKVIEVGNLLLDILIDIAHPDRPQDTRR